MEPIQLPLTHAYTIVKIIQFPIHGKIAILNVVLVHQLLANNTAKKRTRIVVIDVEHTTE